MGADDGLPKIPFASPAEWEQWLEDNYAASEGLWIKIAKKDAGIDSVRYPEVLEIALCFGWIDGRREALDERCFLQRFTPRRARSKWSRINREKAERLFADGRMRPAGLAEVERARADGRWEAAGDARAAAGEVRRDARGAREDLPVAPAGERWYARFYGWLPLVAGSE